jgi:hypothetical protein
MESLAAVLLTALLIALLLAYNKGGLSGHEGIGQWLKAKFLGG